MDGPTLDRWRDQRLAKRGEVVRAAATAVKPWLTEFDDVLFEPVKSAVTIKRAETFAEVPSKRSGALVALIVPCEVEGPRIARSASERGIAIVDIDGRRHLPTVFASRAGPTIGAHVHWTNQVGLGSVVESN